MAYGDPDPSTNFILTLQAAPRASIDVGPPPVDIALDIAPDVSGDTLEPAGSDLIDAGSSGAVGGLTPPSQAGSGTPARARLATQSASTPWWVWLVVPFVLGGAVALSLALDAVPDLATRRPGALTRLTADLEHRS